MCRYTPATTASITTTATEADVFMSGWNIATNEIAATRQRSKMSMAGFGWIRPNIAKVIPSVLTRTSSVSAICNHPVVVTMLERVKIANVMRVMGAQIFSASNMVFMNDTLAIRAETAAVSEVGGDNSPHTDSRNTKKCPPQGSMPACFIGGTMITAPMM